MDDIKEFEFSIELQIGTIFHFKNQLHEVVEAEQSKYRCLKCAFYDKFWNDPMCQIVLCGKSERHDKKPVFFKVVEQSKEEK